ncbi:MAG: serine hydrolase [Cytophagales bacterium]|nr:serine hydrolase [Cytophagales bacterium]
MFKNFFFLLLLLLQLKTLAQDAKARWVDSVFQTLNPTEKISQLFLVPADAEVQKLKPGGILVTQAGAYSHANQVNKHQREADVPLLVAAWNLRPVDSLWAPTVLQLAGLTQPTLIEQAAAEVARQQQLLGIHLTFLSVLPGPPAWGTPEHSLKTSRMWNAWHTYIKAVQQQGVRLCLSNATAAPDTTRLQQLLPLATGLITSHTRLIDFEKDDLKKIDEDELNATYGYNGLLIADIAHLKQLAGKQPDGEVELLALHLGHTLLIGSEDMAPAIRKILRATRKDKNLVAHIDAAVKTMLGLKYDAGLHQNKIINTDNLNARLHNPTAALLQYQLTEASATVVKNQNGLLPIAQLEHTNFFSVSVGAPTENEFTRYLSKYAPFTHLALAQPGDTTLVKSKLAGAHVVVVALFAEADVVQVAAFINSLAKSKVVIVASFGSLENLKLVSRAGALLCGYTSHTDLQKVFPQLIFGGIAAQGVLPVTLAGYWDAGTGVLTNSLNRLSYTLPEAAGVDSKTLEKIETIAREAIDSMATPGSYVMVIKDGKVIYDRATGWLTYAKKIPVTENTLYDLASVTKVAATLQTVMFLYEKGLIDIYKKASVYLPELKKSNKKDYTLKDILTHQAGLWPFLPFWAETVKNGTPLPEYYSSKKSADYPFPVTENMFASKAMKDSLWQWIIKARVREKPVRTTFDYRYSDMGFYILQHLAEKLVNQPMEDFLEQNLYEPLGATTLGYLPLNRFDKNRIAPTEDDKLFRKGLLVGYVHDQGAAMHGNIAGHAGLFGNANDLAKLGQMLLQKGSYGGHQYYKPETVELFTTRQFDTSRRGLGWDKPTPSDWAGPTTLLASPLTFGHTGFTGTCIWVDPQFNLVFVYLSNRVHPDMNNNKLLSANIRPRIQEVIYKAIFNYCQY